VVDLLLDANADVSITQLNRCTALYVASQNGHNRVVEQLLQDKAGLSTNITSGQDGCTPLHITSSNCHHEVVDLLRHMKIDVFAIDKGGETALHHDNWNGYTEVVRKLLDAKANVNEQTNSGRQICISRAKRTILK
jgi:ankyrin repeat protein